MSADAPKLVAHVVFRFAVGGLENGLVNLINRLSPKAWRHAVISLTDVDREFCRRIGRDDVEYIALGKRPGHAIGLYPRMHSIFRRLRPAIVHTRNIAALEAVVPARLAGVRVCIHGEHGRDVEDLDGTNRRRQWIRRAYRPFVTRYVALSPDLATYLREKVGVPSACIEQIYNGVDTTRFAPAPGRRAALAECPFTAPGLWLVGTVGRLETVKDQTNLARAFVNVVRLHREARARMRLVIVGDGSLRGEIESILDKGGVRELAWLAGERPDIPALLQALDCFVLPSLAEGVSNTILEAMACALPVIATRVGANGELVEDGVSGRLVAARDSDALARAMSSYFEAAATARRHGRAGRQIVERHFSLESMVERYHRLYSQLTTPHADASRLPGAVTAGRRANG